MIVGQIVKQPGEAFTLEMDFSAELVTGETIATAEVTSKDYKTLADSSASFLSLAAAVTTVSTVAKRCQNAAHGAHHVAQFRITTSLGNTYEHEVEVQVAEC